MAGTPGQLPSNSQNPDLRALLRAAHDSARRIAVLETATGTGEEGGGDPTLTVPWVNVSDKPATFPPSAHTHEWAEIEDKPATFPPSAHTHPEYVAKAGDEMSGSLIVDQRLTIGTTEEINPEFVRGHSHNPDAGQGASEFLVSAQEYAGGYIFAQVAFSRRRTDGSWDHAWSLGLEIPDADVASRRFYMFDQIRGVEPLWIDAGGRLHLEGGSTAGIQLGSRHVFANGDGELEVDAPIRANGELLGSVDLSPIDLTTSGVVGVGEPGSLGGHVMEVYGRMAITEIPGNAGMGAHLRFYLIDEGTSPVADIYVAGGADGSIGAIEGDLVLRAKLSANKVLVLPARFYPDSGQVRINADGDGDASLYVQGSSSFHIPLDVRAKPGTLGDQLTSLFRVRNEAGTIKAEIDASGELHCTLAEIRTAIDTTISAGIPIGRIAVTDKATGTLAGYLHLYDA